MSVKTVSADQVVRDPSGKISYATHASIPTRAEQVEPRFDLITPFMAIDGEFSQVKYYAGDSWHQAPGRISIVNSNNQTIYDVFVHFNDEDIYDFQLAPAHRNLGVYWADVEPANGARPIAEVEENVRLIFQYSTVVGHATENDTNVFSPHVFEGIETRDTQLLNEYRVYSRGTDRKPALSILAKVILGRDIQGGEHSSLQDARATMDLYLHREQDFEIEQKGCRVRKTGKAGSPATVVGPETAVNALSAARMNAPLPAISRASSATLWSVGAATIKRGDQFSGPVKSQSALPSPTSSNSSQDSPSTISPASSVSSPPNITSPSTFGASASAPPNPKALVDILTAIKLTDPMLPSRTVTGADSVERGGGRDDEPPTHLTHVEAKKTLSSKLILTTSPPGDTMGSVTPGPKFSWAEVAGTKMAGSEAAKAKTGPTLNSPKSSQPASRSMPTTKAKASALGRRSPVESRLGAISHQRKSDYALGEGLLLED